MTSLFCCVRTLPYHPQHLSHETKFANFMAWSSFPRVASPSGGDDGMTDLVELSSPFAIQLVQQINFGPLESKRYFIPANGGMGEFIEIVEDDLIRANFKKLNSYKNYKCHVHNKFFEVNVYQKDPFNEHHWRADIARPAGLIDL